MSLTEIIICYFNNKALEKWANGKALNIMTSAQFFATYLRLVVLGCCLLIVMKFQDKFASLRQLHSPNGNQDKFQICCINMY